MLSTVICFSVFTKVGMLYKDYLFTVCSETNQTPIPHVMEVIWSGRWPSGFKAFHG